MKITVGRVLAGAAMAAGAVMVTAAAFPDASLGGTFEKIGDWLKGLFQGGGQNTTNMGNWLETGTGKAVAGSALLGGGYALHRSMHHQENSALEAQQSAELEGMAGMGGMARGGFAEQIAIDRAMMRARAAMAQQTPELCACAPMR